MSLCKTNITFNAINAKNMGIFSLNANLILSVITIKGIDIMAKVSIIKESHAQIPKNKGNIETVLLSSHAIVDDNDGQWLLNKGYSNHLSRKKRNIFKLR